jgi:hypothetical protein
MHPERVADGSGFPSMSMKIEHGLLGNFGIFSSRQLNRPD